jgi:hypothetical protein
MHAPTALQAAKFDITTSKCYNSLILSPPPLTPVGLAARLASKPPGLRPRQNPLHGERHPAARDTLQCRASIGIAAAKEKRPHDTHRTL